MQLDDELRRDVMAICDDSIIRDDWHVYRDNVRVLQCKRCWVILDEAGEGHKTDCAVTIARRIKDRLAEGME